jgi:hypothetical protein
MALSRKQFWATVTFSMSWLSSIRPIAPVREDSFECVFNDMGGQRMLDLIDPNILARWIADCEFEQFERIRALLQLLYASPPPKYNWDNIYNACARSCSLTSPS